MSDYFDMTGKVVLVTGGSRGLGLEMVRAFAACGADVIIASRKLEPCEAAAAEVLGPVDRREPGVVEPPLPGHPRLPRLRRHDRSPVRRRLRPVRREPPSRVLGERLH